MHGTGTCMYRLGIYYHYDDRRILCDGCLVKDFFVLFFSINNTLSLNYRIVNES